MLRTYSSEFRLSNRQILKKTKQRKIRAREGGGGNNNKNKKPKAYLIKVLYLSVILSNIAASGNWGAGIDEG